VSARPPVEVEAVVVEFAEGTGYLAMWPDGTVRAFATPAEVLREVRALDRRRARRKAVIVTRLEWRAMPAGFEVPS
jgi:hypothetical protein